MEYYLIGVKKGRFFGFFLWYFILLSLFCPSSDSIPLYRRMLRSYPWLLRLWHWQSDALTLIGVNMHIAPFRVCVVNLTFNFTNPNPPKLVIHYIRMFDWNHHLRVFLFCLYVLCTHYFFKFWSIKFLSPVFFQTVLWTSIDQIFFLTEITMRILLLFFVLFLPSLAIGGGGINADLDTSGYL